MHPPETGSRSRARRVRAKGQKLVLSPSCKFTLARDPPIAAMLCAARKQDPVCPQEPALLEPSNTGGLLLKVEAACSRATSAGDWLSALSRYRAPSNVRGAVELLVTAIPFVLLWIVAW